MKCPNCQNECQDGWKACPACGAKLQDKKVCPACGQPIDAAWKACPFCGASASQASTGPGITDSVIKGNVSSTQGTASVGSIHISVPGAAGSETSGHASLLVCPLCGRRNKPDGVFRCRKCGQDHLCLEHFVRDLRMCEECAAKDAGTRAPAAGRAPEVQKSISVVSSTTATDMEKELILDLGNRVTMKFVLIPTGDFLMGSGDNDESDRGDENPQHRVTITRPFYMGAYPVTQFQYKQITGKNPSNFKGDPNPVEHVSWLEAEEFCGAISSRAGRQVQLPTEAQWEYVCRAGTQKRYYFGDDAAMLGRYAWFKNNSGGTTHPVGQKNPNAWGLYDMHGNVWEWCADCWSFSYANAGHTDPEGAGSGIARVLRGGSWFSIPRVCRSACRNRSVPDGRSSDIGFRIVMDLK